MQRIKVLFDYMYYRIYKFYYKWDKDSGITANITVSMFQSTTISLVLILIIKSLFSKWEIVPYSKQLGWGFVGIFLILCEINKRYYTNKYLEFDNIWGQENKQVKKRRGWLIIFFLLIPWLIFLLLGILNKN